MCWDDSIGGTVAVVAAGPRGAFFGATRADIERSIVMDLKKTSWLKALLLMLALGGAFTLSACDFDDESEIEVGDSEIEVDDDDGEIEIDPD